VLQTRSEIAIRVFERLQAECSCNKYTPDFFVFWMETTDCCFASARIPCLWNYVNRL